MEVINLNLIPNGTNPVVHVSQYDEGRDFRFNLFDGTSVLTLDGTETIECDVKKPDGNIVTVAVTNTSDSYIVITTTLQMCACSGNSLGTIKISKGGDNLYTLNFVLFCEMSPLENGIQSDSAIHNLDTQIYNAVADQYDSNNVIFDNAPTSGHGTPYTVTSEGILSAIPDELADLSDVTTNTPLSGEALVWDGTKWTNGTVSTVGSIDDLNDVDTTGKADGDSLRYDANASEWVAKPVTVALTQAEYDALVLSGDLAPNTHYVITDASNLNPTASDIEYSSGVTVKQAIDSENKPNTASYLYKPTVTEPTLTTGDNHNHRTYYYKHGTKVCLSIGVKNLSVGLMTQSLFTLPSGYRPRYALSMACCGYSFDKSSSIQILDNGGVVVQYTQDQGCFGYIEFDAYS